MADPKPTSLGASFNNDLEAARCALSGSSSASNCSCSWCDSVASSEPCSCSLSWSSSVERKTLKETQMTSSHYWQAPLPRRRCPEDDIELQELEVVKTIGAMLRFIKFTELGTGTFGVVFLVKHKTTATYYALKVMRKCDVVRL